MAYWFIRLGNAPELAKKHSLVTVGYNIDKNLIGDDREKVRNYFNEKKLRDGGSARAYGQYIGQVFTFINNIKIGDTMICPFDGGYRIGEVISECNIVESFFDNEKKLASALGKYSKNKEDPQEIKPAIKIKWLTEETLKIDFPQEIKAVLAKPMLRTVNRLKLNISEELILEKFISSQRRIDEAKEDTKKQKEINEKLVINTAITAIITATFSALATALVNKMPNYFVAILSIALFGTALFVLWLGLKGYYNEWFIILWTKMKDFFKWVYTCPDHCCCCKCKRY